MNIDHCLHSVQQNTHKVGDSSEKLAILQLDLLILWHVQVIELMTLFLVNYGNYSDESVRSLSKVLKSNHILLIVLFLLYVTFI